MLLKKLLKIIAIIVITLVVALTGLITFGPVSNMTAVLGVLFGYTIDSPTDSTIKQRLKVPTGFTVSHYARNLGHIRFMVFSNTGDLLISQPRSGQILKLKADTDHNGKHNGKDILLGGLERPHGLALHNNWLYIAESNAVGRIGYDHNTGELIGEYQKIITGLTDNGNHWSKSLLIHNNKLYLSQGSTCNVCLEDDPRRATIMEYDLNGGNGKIFSTGLRNSVGLDAAPWSNDIYATDNGRDLLGDDYPPCELNKIEEDGFYGWPYINGFGDLDPDFGEDKEHLIEQSINPAFAFKAHNAPLGMRFIKHATVPEAYNKTALIALHGSWNRRTPDGYKVIALDWQNDGSVVSRDFLTGFEQNGDVIGRPVDIAEGTDGCIYVSDDYSGSVYRVCYGQSQTPTTSLPEPIADTGTGLENLTQEDISQAAHTAELLIDDKRCFSCHNLNNEGNLSGKSLNQLKGRYQLNDLADYFITPNPPMPQFKLTEEQRRALAIYLLNANQ